MCGGMLQGIFMLSPVDNNQGNISQLVQMSPLINTAADFNSLQPLLWTRPCSAPPPKPDPCIIYGSDVLFLQSYPVQLFSPQVFVDAHLNYLCQSTARSDRAVFNTTRPIWEKDPFHSTYLAACCLAIMGTLNELWSNSQLNALKGMPRGPAWKASGVKCLFFKSAANVGCFQVCYCPAGFPFQLTPAALLMWRRVEARGDGQEKTT